MAVRGKLSVWFVIDINSSSNNCINATTDNQLRVFIHRGYRVSILSLNVHFGRHVYPRRPILLIPAVVLYDVRCETRAQREIAAQNQTAANLNGKRTPCDAYQSLSSYHSLNTIHELCCTNRCTILPHCNVYKSRYNHLPKYSANVRRN